jgi:hypothetical protein
VIAAPSAPARTSGLSSPVRALDAGAAKDVRKCSAVRGNADIGCHADIGVCAGCVCSTSPDDDDDDCGEPSAGRFAPGSRKEKKL